MSSTTTAATEVAVARPAHAERPSYDAIPLRTVMGVELRKMFDTRSGYWMLWSIVGLSAIATGAVILWGGDSAQTYENFASAIGIPMAIVLPMIAVLSVTSEWSQRTGLATFTLVPGRSRVILAKLACVIGAGIASMLVAMLVGAAGNVLGSAIAGVDTVWDFGMTDLLYVIGGNVLGMLMGFTLGLLLRNSAGAIVGYFVFAMVLPTLSGLLAATQDWYADLQRWVDFQFNQTSLYNGGFSGTEWAQLAVTGTLWLLIPMAFGLWRVTRAEVK